jgi:hypothetical protein
VPVGRRACISGRAGGRNRHLRAQPARQRQVPFPAPGVGNAGELGQLDFRNDRPQVAAVLQFGYRFLVALEPVKDVGIEHHPQDAGRT